MTHFDSDYLEGCHPLILEELTRTNMRQTVGYANDEFCVEAREKILAACGNPDAEVEFMVGGTQTNATILKAIMRHYESVISVTSGHINGHEAGAVEATGHKILTLPSHQGKFDIDELESFIAGWRANVADYEHVTWPAVVYISQPTEFGTLYSLAEIERLRRVCDQYDLRLFADGARLGYALASPENDVTLPDMARLCDAFYIGGTKVGALFGEAAVVKKSVIPHFRTVIKQDGALLAKGRLLGVQFSVLFTDNLYTSIAANAIYCAKRMQEGLKRNGLELLYESTTNQTFVIVDDSQYAIFKQIATFADWGHHTDGRRILRLITSWATEPAKVDEFISDLEAALHKNPAPVIA